MAKRGTHSGTTFAPIAEVIALYHEGHSVNAIGERFGVTASAVYSRLKNAGVQFRPHVVTPAALEASRRAHRHGAAHWAFHDLPLDELAKAYAAGFTTQILAARYQVSAQTILRKLKEVGVARRPKGYSHYVTTPDGHRVQSFWESLVCQWLTLHGLPHRCQAMLPWKPTQRADFLVGETYIEVFGVTRHARYEEIRATKLSRYAAHGLHLLQLTPADITESDVLPLHILLH